ncbi:MAG: UDP-3-O-(3-hydroxymyristoyl)glucosamine N-acyltransferase [Nitrospirales bacterium]|nr:UDP-3-O-(3-hydroxymyristoyl)glucosamine N-acyltransferase [Nitrospirales bacterium]
MTISSSSRTVNIPLQELAQAIHATIHGSPDILISGLSHLEGASSGDVSFVLKPSFQKAAHQSQAAALIVTEPIPDDPRPQLVVPNPLVAVTTLAQKYFLPPLPPRGIHPTAVSGLDVRIGPDVSIGALVTIGDRVLIGSGVTIHPGVHIGDDASIGDECILHPHVSLLTKCVIGNRVIVHSGTVIGSDGFGYVQHEGRHHKIPQLGHVIIEDDVELGANVTVDRATFGSTVIKRGTKIDNQVQIAHNVVIGEDCILVAQVGIAGSTVLGRHVMVGGQAGLVDHVTIGDQVKIAAGSGVTKDVKSGQIVGGRPAVEHGIWRRSQVIQYQLPELRKELRALQKQVKHLESLLTVQSASKPERVKSRSASKP